MRIRCISPVRTSPYRIMNPQIPTKTFGSRRCSRPCSIAGTGVVAAMITVVVIASVVGTVTVVVIVPRAAAVVAGKPAIVIAIVPVAVPIRAVGGVVIGIVVRFNAVVRIARRVVV